MSIVFSFPTVAGRRRRSAFGSTHVEHPEKRRGESFSVSRGLETTATGTNKIMFWSFWKEEEEEKQVETPAPENQSGVATLPNEKKKKQFRDIYLFFLFAQFYEFLG